MSFPGPNLILGSASTKALLEVGIQHRKRWVVPLWSRRLAIGQRKHPPSAYNYVI